MPDWPEEPPTRDELEVEERVAYLRALLIELTEELERYGLEDWARRIRDDLEEEL